MDVNISAPTACAARWANRPLPPEFVMPSGLRCRDRYWWPIAAACPRISIPLCSLARTPRISGYMLEAAMEAGFTAAGVNVLLTGPMPDAGSGLSDTGAGACRLGW